MSRCTFSGIELLTFVCIFLESLFNSDGFRSIFRCHIFNSRHASTSYESGIATALYKDTLVTGQELIARYQSFQINTA